MPVTFTVPVPQASMAKAVVASVSLDVEAQTVLVAYQAQDASGNPINGGRPQTVALTFAQLGLTKVGVYNAVLTATGLTGTVT